MTDQLHTILPTFSPVPRAKVRHNGWSAEVQLTFIEALAETGSVRSACRRVNRADHGAYLLRRHPDAAQFRAAWDAALDIGMRRIEDVAMDRALNGVEVPVYSYGKLVGSRTVYNDRLVMFMLRNRAPDRFAGGRAKAMNAADKETVRKLKIQWRKEWEREAAIAANEQARLSGDSFVETIKQMHRRWFCAMSPAARAAYRTFREAEDADDGTWLDGVGLERSGLEGDGPDEAGGVDANRRRTAMTEAAAQADAEYEEWFGDGADRRAHVAKLVDMRAWPRPDDSPGDRPGDWGNGDWGDESDEDPPR